MSKVEFYFDLSSPWTYLAFHNIQPIIAETNAKIRWIPILVGGVFNAVNPGLYAQRADADSPKTRHGMQSIAKWAAWSGLELHFPPTHHPARSVHAMRACCALQDDPETLRRFARAAFESFFGDNKNLDDPAVLAAVADGLGLNGADLMAKTQTNAIKTQLRSNTQNLIDRGGYGSPTIFVNGTDMYFGNDQLPLVKQALEQGGNPYSNHL